ncbi:MAG: methyltransferase domain-containing protein [Allosphingosinicella sp.]
MSQATCQGCGAALTRSLVDLGRQPLANALVAPGTPAPDPAYPLHARVCDRCRLVQVEPVVPRHALFAADYPYFSSFSESWLAHCDALAGALTARLGLGPGSNVVEIGSNDGALLSCFRARGVPAWGVEPSAGVAEAARARGLRTEIAFFGEAAARRLAGEGRADLIVATNVLAHVPDINDFLAGVRTLLAPEGLFAVEFPHLLNLIRETQFDTIYHEHFTYLSLLALRTALERNGLALVDAERQPTHGGSLRVLAGRSGTPSARAVSLIAEEVAAGLDQPSGYAGFAERVETVRRGLADFLAAARERGESVAGYGAAAKGNTLLNHVGASAADIAFVVDRNPAKQGKLLPGSRIPVHPVSHLLKERPDHVLILPWNLSREIVGQLPEVAKWGGRFVTAIPEIRSFSHAD